MFDIITLGSATVDMFVKSKNENIKHEKNGVEHRDIAYHLGEKMLVEDLEINTGGGGTNSAVAFSRLGLKTGFIGALGRDVNGEFVGAELKKEGVEFLGHTEKGKTGLSVILPGKGDRTILTYKGVNDSLSYNAEHLPQTNWLYVSTMIGKSFNSVEKIVAEAKRRNVKIAFNPSLYLAKQGFAKLKKILACVDIVILNKEEAYALTGKTHQKEMLESIAFHVNGIIVITDGASKIYALSGKEFYSLMPHDVKVVDSTGAGDAFASGFVFGIMRGEGIQKALHFGLKESESVLGEIGAKNNLLHHLA
jgi:ribokinase